MHSGGYALLVNPSAGGGRAAKILPTVEAALKQAKLETRVVVTTGLEHGVSEALAACEAGEMPIVMSGDGLIGRIGGALANTPHAMAIIPGGRGNDFARVLGISTEPAEAVAVIAAGHQRTVDVGTANGVRFLCIASCGFDSDANRIANEAKLIRGPLVYAYAALRALVQWKPAHFTVTGGDETLDFEGFSVAVGNSRAYGGGMFVTPMAELDDGALDLVATGAGSKIKFLRGLPEVFKGTHIEREDVMTDRASEFRIEADRPFAVYADGEQITELPATIGVLPGALRVVAAPGPLVGP